MPLLLAKAVGQRVAAADRGPDLLQIAMSTIEATGCDPHDLELEITERLLLDERPGVIGTLTELRRLGFEISVDDFGVGYFNLAQLHRHPIDCLKIDKSFVSGRTKEDFVTLS